LRYLRNEGKKVFWFDLAGAWLINSWLVLRLTITQEYQYSQYVTLHNFDGEGRWQKRQRRCTNR
jgi:hypothetical protein